MKHPKIVSLIVMLIVFSSVAGVCWALSTTHEPNEQPDSPMPKLRIHEQIRDATMQYISANHPETVQFMETLDWAGGRVTPEGLLGAETYNYTSSGWTVTLHYPVVITPVYKVTVNYSVPFEEGRFSIPYAVLWEGNWTNEGIVETSYIFAQ